MKIKTIITLFIFTILFGCKTQQSQSESTISEIKTIQIPVREYSILTVLWQQHAAEYRALAYQAYNTAQLQLDNILRNRGNYEKPLAIVTDIDETVLNNSPYNGKMIELNEEYSNARWIEWGKEKKAEIVPGSLDFFKYAASKGVEIFYISNRLLVQKSETIENMQKLGFPFLDDAHFLLRETVSGKEPRRLQVQKTHKIIMLLGDNLSDFSEVFDNQNTETRNFKVDSLKAAFGNKYIVLPNPMYGDWETKGILEGKYNWTASQKDSIRHSKIISY